MSDGETTAERPTRVTNVWTPVEGRNPYLHNIFVLLEVDPDAPQKGYDRTVTRAMSRVQSNTEWVVHDHPVSATDVSHAEHLAREEAEFVAERLLAHTVHKVGTDEFQEAMQMLGGLQFDDPLRLLPLPVRSLEFLAERLPEQCELAPGDETELPRDRLAELFQPAPADEFLLDE